MEGLTKGQMSMILLKDYFNKLPFSPFREGQMSASEFLAMKNDFRTTSTKLGARSSMLMKELGYRIDSKTNPSSGDGDWPASESKIYPKRILDAAYWFITGQPEANVSKQIYRKVCVDCEIEYETEHNWCIRCKSCYKKAKDAQS